MRDIPNPGQPLQHYRGGVYQFIGEAIHTESRELLAIYCDSNRRVYARPLEMFLSEVPEGKENPTGQHWRFEDI